MSDDWKDKAKELGTKILDDAKGILKEEWDSLTDEDKAWATRTAKTLAELEARSLAGLEVDEERVAILEATLKNFTAAGQIAAYRVQSALLTAAKNAASVAGGFLSGFVKKLLGSIIPGLG